jgi:hypothetical protein
VTGAAIVPDLVRKDSLKGTEAKTGLLISFELKDHGARIRRTMPAVYVGNLDSRTKPEDVQAGAPSALRFPLRLHAYRRRRAPCLCLDGVGRARSRIVPVRANSTSTRARAPPARSLFAPWHR